MPVGRLLVAIIAAAVTAGTFAAARQQPKPPVNATAAAQQEFQKRLQQYLDVRQKAVRQFQPLKPDADQDTVHEREVALAQAIRTARTGAKAGEIFTPDVAPLFRRLAKEDFQRRSTKAKQLRRDELPKFAPAVNQTYPPEWPLQTFPPTLLQTMPKLPDLLEYRFVDNALILRDKQANIVVDFLRNVM
jgi:hypothetical protein